MLINNKIIKESFTGAVYYEEDVEGIIPYRFTEKKLQTTRDNLNKIRHYTASNIKLDFFSDTKQLSFDYTVFTGFSSGMYKHYFFDIYVDNVLVLHQGEKEVFVDRTGRISLNLKDGMKRITIHLPGSCSVRIANFNIDKDAKVESIKYDKKAMFFGDSITHAAYLDFPSLNYSNIISKRLNMKSINQAIGGDVFDKNHLDFLPDFNPDIVFVAYGTNDWLSENDTCQEKSMEYFSKLVSIYGESKVNVILPIWRGDSCAYPELKNSFHDIRNIIKVNAESKGLNVIDGLDFVPHIEMLFYDKFLHPNEMGFAFYADKLENAVKCCSI